MPAAPQTGRDRPRKASAPLVGKKAMAWSSLRKLGNSSLARATIAVPVIGYLLIGSNAFLEWLSPETTHSGTRVALLCTHAWRLVFLYYGLTGIGLATGLFGLFCSPSHKKYGDGVEYALGVNSVYSGDRAWTDLVITLKAHLGRSRFLQRYAPPDLQDDLVVRFKDALDSASGKNPDADLLPKPDLAILTGALRTLFRVGDYEQPLVRLLIFLLYLSGIVVVSISTLWGMTEVAAALFGMKLPASPWCR